MSSLSSSRKVPALSERSKWPRNHEIAKIPEVIVISDGFGKKETKKEHAEKFIGFTREKHSKDLPVCIIIY